MQWQDLQQLLAQFQSYLMLHPVLVTGCYLTVFTALSALCLPGAAVLMLLAGASFGLVWGSVLATLASTAGATLTMLAARYGLRQRIETRFANRLHTVNQGLQRDGALYLLSLRLLPVIPYAVVNLVAGVTRLSGWKFFWISALGMLPGTALYVNAGLHLAQVRSIETLLTLPNLVTLALLGLIPLAVVMVRKNKRSKNSIELSA